MTIVGASFDPPEENLEWSLDEEFTFELWTDEDRILAMAYGAADSASDRAADRKTVVLDADGVLTLQYAVTSIGTHPEQVLHDCAILFGD